MALESKRLFGWFFGLKRKKQKQKQDLLSKPVLFILGNSIRTQAMLCRADVAYFAVHWFVYTTALVP